MPAEPAAPAMMLPEPVPYTPEVMAARQAHFRAYDTAARLAIEADANPLMLERLLRGQAVFEDRPAQVRTNVEESKPVVMPEQVTRRMEPSVDSRTIVSIGLGADSLGREVWKALCALRRTTMKNKELVHLHERSRKRTSTLMA